MIHQHQIKANNGVFIFFSLFPPLSAKICTMRSTDLKYLGYGFGIGALLASLFFAGWFFIPQFNAFGGSSLFGVQDTFVPTITLIPTIQPTTTPTSTAEAVPTIPTIATTTTASAEPATISAAPYTFTPTSLPSPTATLTNAEIMVSNGEIAITGPLTREQQIKLYEASLFFIAPTYEQSKKMSVLINNARFSDPNTTCGPLSIAILQKAGLLSADLVAHDFFLINPDLGKDRITIKSTFPPEKYTDIRYKVRIDEFDWYSKPLVPGDFVYIYSGTGGNFEHMLVVNRVDSQGRAYSVTNYNTEQGFVINEALLYDPADPNAGLFSQWTEKQFQKLGSTGYAGFEVWRLKENP
jgi:hypothetical protein